jgi:hypothetical protein
MCLFDERSLCNFDLVSPLPPIGNFRLLIGFLYAPSLNPSLKYYCGSLYFLGAMHPYMYSCHRWKKEKKGSKKNPNPKVLPEP